MAIGKHKQRTEPSLSTFLININIARTEQPFNPFEASRPFRGYSRTEITSQRELFADPSVRFLRKSPASLMLGRAVLPDGAAA